MIVRRVVLLISLLTLTATAQQNSSQRPSAPRWPATCPVTVAPPNPFTPPAPYDLDGTSGFWLGTEKLWTALPKSGQAWGWMPRERGHEHEVQPLTAKTFWGSVSFNWKEEYPPELNVSGRRLDGSAPPLLTMIPTNAFPGPTAAMLVGIYVPTPGCWEITGEYKSQKVSFVVWVYPVKHGNE